jgi:hypothetical protein
MEDLESEIDTLLYTFRMFFLFVMVMLIALLISKIPFFIPEDDLSDDDLKFSKKFRVVATQIGLFSLAIAISVVCVGVIMLIVIMMTIAVLANKEISVYKESMKTLKSIVVHKKAAPNVFMWIFIVVVVYTLVFVLYLYFKKSFLNDFCLPGYHKDGDEDVNVGKSQNRVLLHCYVLSCVLLFAFALVLNGLIPVIKIQDYMVAFGNMVAMGVFLVLAILIIGLNCRRKHLVWLFVSLYTIIILGIHYSPIYEFLADIMQQKK